MAINITDDVLALHAYHKAQEALASEELCGGIDETCGECNECSTYCDVCSAWYSDDEPCEFH